VKISNVSNDSITLQARNAQDFEKALQVADKMESITEKELVVVSYCEHTWWVQLTSRWYNKQASEWREVYQLAKKSI